MRREATAHGWLHLGRASSQGAGQGALGQPQWTSDPGWWTGGAEKGRWGLPAPSSVQPEMHFLMWLLTWAQHPFQPSESNHGKHTAAKQVGLRCVRGGVGQAPRMMSMSRTGLVALSSLVS